MTGSPFQALDLITLPAALVPITEPTAAVSDAVSDVLWETIETDPAEIRRLADEAFPIVASIAWTLDPRGFGGEWLAAPGLIARAAETEARRAQRWGSWGADLATGDLAVVECANREAEFWICVVLYLISGAS